MGKTRRFVPLLTLAAAQAAIGAAAIFARFALEGARPLAVTAGRLAIAAAILLVAAAVRRDLGRARSAQDRRIFASAGIALGLHFTSWIWSLEYTSVAISTLLVTTTPIWTSIYDACVQRRPIRAMTWLAMAIGAAGLVLVVGFSAARVPLPGHALLGGGLALFGAIAIGAYLTLVRSVRPFYSTRAIVTRTYTWAAAATVLGAILTRQGLPALHDTTAWGGIVAMALISQLLGHTALNAALRWFSPSAVSFTTLLEPLIAGAIALALFGERLSPQALCGGALVLVAIAIFLRQESIGERAATPSG